MRKIYDHIVEELAAEWVAEIVRDFTDPEMTIEVRRLGRSIARWRTRTLPGTDLESLTADRSRKESGQKGEAGIRFPAFGIRNFDYHHIRSLLYAGKPDWALLSTISPP